MDERRCMRCGTELPYGSLVYVVQVKVFADFDGVILESEEESRRPLDRLIEQVRDKDAEELEKEVFEEFTLILCKRCRDQFVDESTPPRSDSPTFRRGRTVFSTEEAYPRAG